MNATTDQISAPIPTALRVDCGSKTSMAIIFGTETFSTMHDACVHAARMMNDGHGCWIVDTLNNVLIDSENYEQYA